MRIIYTLVSLFLFAGLFYLGHYSSVNTLPPLVKFMNPYSGFWQQAEGSNLPRRYFEGPVGSEVKISFDDRWVPHIYADTYQDALYAQGILHAYFRLWQMDITQRGSLGRVSEVLGNGALEYDKTRRKIGMKYAADQLANNLEKFPETKNLVESYLQGTNSIIDNLTTADYPLEFKLLNYEPEAWTISHMCGIIMAMNYDLCFKHDDLASTLNFHQFGDSLYREYFPTWNPLQVPIIQKGKEAFQQSRPYKAPVLDPQAVFQLPEMPDEGIGSNNWAIQASKTMEGHNILANDPHLGLNLPSVWYEMHIHLPERDIYGVSFPGIPGIVLGFNSHYSWGSTNVGHDVADWYRLVWEDSTHQRYLLNGEWKSPEIQKEVIWLKSGDSVEIEVPVTEFGRVAYPEKDHPLRGCAFHWGAVMDCEDIPLNTFVGFNLGTTYEDFKSALKHHEFAAQNFVFSDKGDNIAMHVQGKLPIRKSGKGEFILDSIQSPQWSGFIPQEELPFENNPDRSFVSSANQHSTYPSYPYAYHGRFDDYRGRVLDSFLNSYQNISVEKVKEFQLNNYSIEAEEVLPVLLGQLQSGQEREREAIQLLAEWNYVFSAEAKAAVIFDLWWEETQRLTQDELDTSKGYMDQWRVLQLIKEQPGDPLFDRKSSSAVEDAQSIIQSAFENALDSFQNKGEPDWGTYKGTLIQHIARIPALSSDVIHNGGYKNALNAIRRTKGPSWRMVVEMSNEIKAWGIYPGGQSGNPGSTHYDNQIEDWVNGNYYLLEPIQEPGDDRFVRQWTIKKAR